MKLIERHRILHIDPDSPSYDTCIELLLPKDFEVLRFKGIKNELFAYIICSSSKLDLIRVVFFVKQAGDPIPENLEYVGSGHLHDLSELHFFVKKEQ